MKIAMMNISDFGTSLFIFIFASSFLVQNGTPMRHLLKDVTKTMGNLTVPNLKGIFKVKEPNVFTPPAELPNLKGKAKTFYDSVIMEMLKECRNGHLAHKYGSKPYDSPEDGKLVCETVDALNGYLTEMDTEYKLVKAGTKEENLKEIDNISQKIFDFIMYDNDRSMKDSKFSLNPQLLGECSEEFKKVENDRASLHGAFEGKVEKMIGELKKKQDMPNMGIAESLKIAYKLHWFGDKICDLFMENHGKEKMEWAFDLFVANLAVYSFRLEHPVKGAKGEIQKIVEKWWENGQHQMLQMNTNHHHQVETIKPSGTEKHQQMANQQQIANQQQMANQQHMTNQPQMTNQQQMANQQQMEKIEPSVPTNQQQVKIIEPEVVITLAAADVLTMVKDYDEKYISGMVEKCTEKEFVDLAKMHNVCVLANELHDAIKGGGHAEKLEKIYAIISGNLNKLYSKYEKLLVPYPGRGEFKTLAAIMINEADGLLPKITKNNEELGKVVDDVMKFKHPFSAINTDVTNWKMAFKLLHIGTKMEVRIMNGSADKKVEWALRQFAVTLAAYSRCLSEKPDIKYIQGIVRNIMNIEEEEDHDQQQSN